MDPVFQRYLTEAEEKRLFTYVAQFADILARRDHAWMRLLRQTGIRVGALAGLTVDDARAALRPPYRLPLADEHAKRNQGGDVSCTVKARAALKDLLAIRAEMGHAAIGSHPLVMSREHGGMSVRTIQHRMRQWVQAAGLAVEASPHWFRHTLAKRIMARSTAAQPLVIVQGVLGHRSPSSTLVYAGPDREDMETALEEAS